MNNNPLKLNLEHNLSFEDMSKLLPGVKLEHGVYGNITKLTLTHKKDTVAEVFYDQRKERFIYSGEFDNILCQDLGRTYQTHLINFSGVQEFVNPDYREEDMILDIAKSMEEDWNF